MGKYICLLISVLLVLLSGCHAGWTGRSPIPAPGEHLTTLEAYEQIRPVMQAWDKDSVVVSISSVVAAEPQWRVDSTGKAPWWIFIVQSPGTLKTTEISWIAGEIIVGLDQIPDNEFTAPSPIEKLPLPTMIDSSAAVNIASESGVDSSAILLDIGIDHYDSANHELIPPSWGLTYASPDDSSQDMLVLIDAVTSEVLRNDFSEP